MIIDVHAHIWGRKVDANAQQLIEACELYGIDKVFISPLQSHNPDEEEIEFLSGEVYRICKKYPKNFLGYEYVNPALRNAMDVLKRGVEERGMIGMKLWVSTLCDDPRVYPLVEQCIRYDIPVLIHSFVKTVGQLEFESTGANVKNLAVRYPEAKLIMAHLGANCYHGIKAIRDYQNVFVDISGSIYRRDDLDYTVRQIGTDRILFGTDMPGTFTMNYGQVLEADLSDREREDILYNNAVKLFNLGDRI